MNQTKLSCFTPIFLRTKLKEAVQCDKLSQTFESHLSWENVIGKNGPCILVKLPMRSLSNFTQQTYSGNYFFLMKNELSIDWWKEADIIGYTAGVLMVIRNFSKVAITLQENEVMTYKQVVVICYSSACHLEFWEKKKRLRV